jgi:hypothetical protein
MRRGLVLLALFAVSCAAGTPKPATDPARAEAVLLTAKDFPQGWRARHPVRDKTDERLDRQLSACIHRPLGERSARAFGDSFSDGIRSVSSEAIIVRSAEEASKDAAATASARGLTCARAQAKPRFLQELRRRAIGATIRSVTVSRVPFEGTDVDGALRVVIVIDLKGNRLGVYSDVVFLHRGRAEVTATFTNLYGPFDPSFERRLLKAVAGKLARI